MQEQSNHPETPAKKTVVFILSADFSGSTYLALTLGSHSQAAYVGELYKMFLDDPIPCRLCEERGRQCEIFGDVATTRSENIHHLVLEKTQKRVLVDNSKTISWSQRFLSEIRFQRKYIQLIRDPRGIAFSMQLRHQQMDISSWIKQNCDFREFLQENQCDHRVITYNELAEETDKTLTESCHWLGLSFEPGQKQYWNFEHHGPGRNGATAAFLENYISPDKQFYDKAKTSQFHDLRWKEGVDARTTEMIMSDSRMKNFLTDFHLDFSETGLTRKGQ